MKALLIYSGGLDSTTLLHQYQQDIGLAVSFHYGSKHNDIELRYAAQNCERLGVEHLVILLPFFGTHFRSSLLQGGGAIPEGHYTAETMRSTVVPFRNGIMLSIAAGIAESCGLDAVLIGNHAGDHTIYPDCRPDFVQAFGEAVQLGTDGAVRLLSPYCELTKRDIVLIGKELGVDYGSTYSCYKGGEVHCGVCGTCTERREALEGFDTTIYGQ